ncbi:acyl-CoA dehydrogenase [Litorivicinus lipolyticus]|uniref:acyl-CoA dehydrogenase n=1 Tax=Litorivicinus lipolyticus TaxID=418701 RepID=UPI003B5990CF
MSAGVATLVVTALLLAMAYRGSSLRDWSAALLFIGVVLAISDFGSLWLVPGIVAAVLCIRSVRMRLVTRPAYGLVRKILPKVSPTEQEALDAGTVGWDAELFSGSPNWDTLAATRAPTLTDDEQAFMDGPTHELCKMLDNWDISHHRRDLPPAVWAYIRDNGFLGMLIEKQHGGLGFSAQAQSMVVSKIGSRSVAAAITVMVPNSLGPGELLTKYGTDQQKSYYLPRLADGTEIPCFALTGPNSGSDAGSMHDVGVVCERDYNGQPTLGVALTFDKRYITLAPVATLIGLAFRLHDPEQRLGQGTDVGITLALLPHDHPGVSTGRRHYPCRNAFMNGPVTGTDVFVPMEFLIGGADYAGQGWRMLMECLSVGRAISLPAIGTTATKATLRTTSAYARVRRQFGIAIGRMEGVAEPLADMVKTAYVFEGARAATAAMVDDGEKPSVVSALMKYQATEAMRRSYDNAMDIHGGKAICDGPSNYLFADFGAVPVGITVEGANILTRTLITFAQGALRAHPWLYKEIQAAQADNADQGANDFDTAMAGHTRFTLQNLAASLVHNLSAGRLASAPDDAGHEQHWYRQLHRMSHAFALVADLTVVVVGGDLKRKQMISGRLADALAELYLIATSLKRFRDDGRPDADQLVLDASIQDALARFQGHIDAVIDNFPVRPVAWLMRACALPLGRTFRPTSDRVNYRLAKAILVPGEWRDRMTRDMFVSDDAADVTGVLEAALTAVTAVEDIEQRFLKGMRKGLYEWRHDQDAIEQAVGAGVISADEAAQLRDALRLTDQVVAVDHFDPRELAPGAQA